MAGGVYVHGLGIIWMEVGDVKVTVRCELCVDKEVIKMLVGGEVLDVWRSARRAKSSW